jgi:hypothetical protein
VVGATLGCMVDRIGSPAAAEAAAPACDASWLLVDLLASIVGYDAGEVARHLRAMSARGSSEGQVEIVATLWRCDHPQVAEALDLLGGHHPDHLVAREARKSAMRARTRAIGAS